MIRKFTTSNAVSVCCGSAADRLCEAGKPDRYICQTCNQLCQIKGR